MLSVAIATAVLRPGPEALLPAGVGGEGGEKKGMVAWASGPAWAQPLPSTWRGGDEKAEQELGEGTPTY